MKKFISVILSLTLCAGVCFAFAGCESGGGSANEQVVIYSNADEEAITAMQNALDNNGYEGQYHIPDFRHERAGRKAAGGRN